MTSLSLLAGRTVCLWHLLSMFICLGTYNIYQFNVCVSIPCSVIGLSMIYAFGIYRLCLFVLVQIIPLSRL